MGVHVWSKEEKEYISEIAFGHNVKEIQKMMNEKFNYPLAASIRVNSVIYPHLLVLNRHLFPVRLLVLLCFPR